MPLKGQYLDYYYDPLTKKRYYAATASGASPSPVISDAPVGPNQCTRAGVLEYLDDGTRGHNPAYLDPASELRVMQLLQQALVIGNKYPGLSFASVQYGPKAEVTGPYIVFALNNQSLAPAGTTLNQPLVNLCDTIEATGLQGDNSFTVFDPKFQQNYIQAIQTNFLDTLYRQLESQLKG